MDRVTPCHRPYMYMYWPVPSFTFLAPNHMLPLFIEARALFTDADRMAAMVHPLPWAVHTALASGHCTSPEWQATVYS